jgi:hypothetical protein
MPREINPGHRQVRSVLRTLGPVILVIGLAFTVVGIGSFFASFGSFGPPRYFWCAFVGMPLVVAGIAITQAGFLGAIARYHAQEGAPVAKDTLNYLAAGTKEGIRDVAEAVGAGLARTEPFGATTCTACGADNDADARFCHACGERMEAGQVCPDCQETNRPDARFCDNCGRTLA